MNTATNCDCTPDPVRKLPTVLVKVRVEYRHQPLNHCVVQIKGGYVASGDILLGDDGAADICISQTTEAVSLYINRNGGSSTDDPALSYSFDLGRLTGCRDILVAVLDPPV